jgi:serine/threonine protein kinase
MIEGTISHYKIMGKLGEGGMGEVYLAEDIKLKRKVALKFLPSRIKADDADKNRFLQEARAAAALNHPNVCVVHDIKESEGRQFIVMEYVKGQTLKELIHEEPLPLPRVLDYATQIADALLAAHQQDILHRDVKSENIMVSETGQVKVMDFGLAKLKGSINLSRTSSTAGTVGYQSPESLHGREVDARSDIFSYGIVLYEMITGRLPFRGEYEAAMIYSILNEEPEPIQKHRTGLSSEILHILNRALEKNPEDRYQSMRDLLIDLKRLKRDTGKSAPVSQVSPQENRDKGRNSPGKKKWLGIGLILAVAIYLAVHTLNKRRGPLHPSQLEITQVTAHGKAKEAAISPDGKYIIHVMEEQGKQSLWLRQVATNSNVEIIAPSEVRFIGMTFSNDGNYIYYVSRTLDNIYGSLYKLPILGGSKQKIIDRVSSPITFSPDSQQLAFIRLKFNPVASDLIVFDPDRHREKILATAHSLHDLQPWGISWSPDGKVIATIKSDPRPGREPVLLEGISVADGSIRPLTGRRWGSINQIAWLNDGQGLIISAADRSTGYFYQLWRVSHPGGKAERITPGFNNYLNVSATRDMNTLLTTRSDWRSNIRVTQAGKPDEAQQITSGTYAGFMGLDWTPDGKLVYGSRDFKIWIINRDGSGQKLLSGNEPTNWNPGVSPDGRFIVFQSWRGNTAGTRLWIMDNDGGNPRQLTRGNKWDDCPRVSPDGKWVVYHSQPGGQPTLWKISSSGGKPVQLLNFISYTPAISPDGKWIASFASEESLPSGTMQLVVIPFSGGQPVFRFPLPADDSGWNDLRWTPDGKKLAYLVQKDGARNIWTKTLDQRPPVQLTHLKNLRIYHFDWSNDGKYLAYSCGVMDDDVVLIRNFR